MRQGTNRGGRAAWLDIARGMCMLSVVWGHFLLGIDKQNALAYRVVSALYSYDMPAFFFLSGLTFRPGNRGFGSFLQKRARRLLWPAYGFSFLYLLYAAVRHVPLFSTFSVGAFLKGPVFFRDTWCSRYWFLPVLLVMSVAFYFLSKLHLATSGSVAVALFALNLSQARDGVNVHLPLAAEIAALAAPFFWAGLLAQQIWRLREARRAALTKAETGDSPAETAVKDRARRAELSVGGAARVRHLAAAVSLLFLLDRVQRRFPGFVQMSANYCPSVMNCVLGGLIGTACVLLFALALQRCRPLELVGQRSLEVYGLHYLLLGVCKRVFPGANGTEGWLPVFWCFCCALLAALLVLLVVAAARAAKAQMFPARMETHKKKQYQEEGVSACAPRGNASIIRNMENSTGKQKGADAHEATGSAHAGADDTVL